MADAPRTTLRQATIKNRPLFEALRRATELRATTLRYHLGARFRDLAPWVGNDPWGLFFDPNGLLVNPPVPDHERFWSVIRSAEEREDMGGDPTKYVEDVLQPGHTAPDGFAFPYEWREPARRIFMVRGIIRSDAARHLRRESRKQQEVWQRGHDICPANNDRPCREQHHPCGLTNFVQADGVRENWVIGAISWLRYLQLEGTSEESDRATEILKGVAKMLWQVGSGDESERSPEERAAEKKRQNRINGAVRTLKRRFAAAMSTHAGDRGLAHREAVGDEIGGEGALVKLDATERGEALRRFAEWADQRDSRGK